MANKWTALNTFWNSFNIPAYDENTVPDAAVMPYITYEASISGFDEKIQLMASLWYYSSLWSDISEKAKEIEDYIGGGVSIPYDGGRLWINRGYTFAQRMSEPGSDMTRRIVLQIEAEFQ